MTRHRPKQLTTLGHIVLFIVAGLLFWAILFYAATYGGGL